MSSDAETEKERAGKRARQLYPLLLLSLVFVLFVIPIADALPFAATLLRVGISAVLILAVITSQHRGILLAAGGLIAIIAVPVSWATMFINRPGLFLFSCVMDSLLFITMAVAILISVIRKHLANILSIYGAISAYLLLGLAWAVLYWGIYRIFPETLDLGSLAGGPGKTEVGELSQFIYFSFVTMSTLGYGDITPKSPVTMSITWMQSVCGQFYMAVLVAWLVSEIPSRRHQSAESD